MVGVILSILALFLFIIIAIIDLFFLMIYKTKDRKWYQLINERHFQKAFNIDVFGNYQFNELWNLILSKGNYKFGRFGETLSSCLGKKQLENSLSLF